MSTSRNSINNLWRLHCLQQCQHFGIKDISATHATMVIKLNLCDIFPSISHSLWRVCTFVYFTHLFNTRQIIVIKGENLTINSSCKHIINWTLVTYPVQQKKALKLNLSKAIECLLLIMHGWKRYLSPSRLDKRQGSVSYLPSLCSTATAIVLESMVKVLHFFIEY